MRFVHQLPSQQQMGCTTSLHQALGMLQPVHAHTPCTPAQPASHGQQHASPSAGRPSACAERPCAHAEPHLHGQDEEYAGFGGPHCMVREGYSAITDALAAGLDLRLNCPVTRVEDSEVGVRVVSATGAALC